MFPFAYKAMISMLSHSLNVPPLPYKAMISMLSHYLNFPPSALQSNDQHAVII